MENDTEIYEGKKFSDLCKNIIENSAEKKNQIDILISDIRAFITDTPTALQVAPMVVDFIDTGVKNDEQLVKLAAIIQRTLNKPSANVNDSEFGITDEERKMLLDEADAINKAAKEIKNKGDEIVKKINSDK